MTDGIEKPRRVIVTKRKTYVLPAAAVGVPISERFSGVTWSGPMANAKVYDTEDGPVVARPDDGEGNQA